MGSSHRDSWAHRLLRFRQIHEALKFPSESLHHAALGLIHRHRFHPEIVSHVSRDATFRPDGKRIASGSSDKTIKLSESISIIL
jgi:WD40 repeat protein